MPRRPRRSHYLPVLIAVAMLVNLPWAHSAWVSHQIERDGVDTTATVVGHGTSGSWHYVRFTLPEDIDPEQPTWQVEVDEATYDAAVASGTLEVRVLPDDPAQHQVDGEVGSGPVVVLTLVVDLLLLMVGLLLWWAGRSRPGPLRLLAIEDVRRGPPGGALDQIAPETYLVRGEVSEIRDGLVVLDLEGKVVEVLLNGYRNPVGHQQPAQVHARLA